VARFFDPLQLVAFLCCFGFGGGVGLGWLVLAIPLRLVGLGGVIFVATFGIINLTL
jgi:hypothetical protein